MLVIQIQLKILMNTPILFEQNSHFIWKVNRTHYLLTMATNV